MTTHHSNHKSHQKKKADESEEHATEDEATPSGGPVSPYQMSSTEREILTEAEYYHLKVIS